MSQKKPVIVAVDDNKRFLESLKAVFAKYLPECTLVVYSNPFLAMGQAKSLNPDVLVIDFLIRSCDGIQVIRELRRQGVMAPAIVLSGFDGLTISKRLCPENHIHKILEKAEHPEVLINSVREALNGSREEAFA